MKSVFEVHKGSVGCVKSHVLGVREELCLGIREELSWSWRSVMMSFAVSLGMREGSSGGFVKSHIEGPQRVIVNLRRVKWGFAKNQVRILEESSGSRRNKSRMNMHACIKAESRRS